MGVGLITVINSIFYFIVLMFLLIAVAAPGWYYHGFSSTSADASLAAPAGNTGYTGYFGVGLWETCTYVSWKSGGGFSSLRCQRMEDFCRTYLYCPNGAPCTASANTVNICAKGRGSIGLIITALGFQLIVVFLELWGAAGQHPRALWTGCGLSILVAILSASATGVFGSIQRQTMVTDALATTYPTPSPATFGVKYKYSFGLLIASWCLSILCAIASGWTASMIKKRVHDNKENKEAAHAAQQSNVAL